MPKKIKTPESVEYRVDKLHDGSIVKMSKVNPCLAYILIKMCRAVGAEPESVDFKSHDWYMKHTWTRLQEREFRDWLAKYLGGSKEARIELLNRSCKPKVKELQKAADEFIWMYGWKLEPSEY